MRRWLEIGFAERILPSDGSATRAYAEIAADRRGAGRPIGDADYQSAPYPARAAPARLRGTFGTSEERESR